MPNTVGITALVPPELVYACGCSSLDINNFVPQTNYHPRDKLCAWTAIWRDLALENQIRMDKLVVVTGGDCNNAIVDGEKLERHGIETHYFSYPFDGSQSIMGEEISKLADFLGNDIDHDLMEQIARIKRKALAVDKKRTAGKVGSKEGFSILVSGSDLGGDPLSYASRMDNIEETNVPYDYRVALLGTPPIYRDFHGYLQDLGLHVVFDEMPFEFINHTGNDLDSISASYSEYTFARNITFRLASLKEELKNRKVDGVIHFHQFSCHHKLEDPILREALLGDGYAYISIEADLPQNTPEQAKLRLEAFKEMLGEYQ